MSEAQPASRLQRLQTVLLLQLARGFAFVIGRSMRLRTCGEVEVAGYRGLGPGPLIFALWHGDIFPFLHYGRRSEMCAVVSSSRDGEILARLMQRHGYRTVRGSSTRGGARAIIETSRLVCEGSDAAIAVDGPRGPAFQVKDGVIRLAGLTGCPIVPVGAGIGRCKRFPSWDGFRLPVPLSRVVLVAGAPILVDRGASREEFSGRRADLEQAMLEVRQRAESLVAGSAFRRLSRPLGLAAIREREPAPEAVPVAGPHARRTAPASESTALTAGGR